MLVALDGSWAFALPKKTASQSLSGMLAPIDNGGDGPNYARTIGGFHNYQWDGDGKRYMVVRNPQERLASMYWWSKREGNFNVGPGGPDEWLRRFAVLLSQRWKGDAGEWLVTQGAMAREFRPDRVFRLEDGLDAVLRFLGVSIERVQFRNTTNDGGKSERRPFAETFTVIPTAIQAWLDDDLLR